MGEFKLQTKKSDPHVFFISQIYTYIRLGKQPENSNSETLTSNANISHNSPASFGSVRFVTGVYGQTMEGGVGAGGIITITTHSL